MLLAMFLLGLIVGYLIFLSGLRNAMDRIIKEGFLSNKGELYKIQRVESEGK